MHQRLAEANKGRARLRGCRPHCPAYLGESLERLLLMVSSSRSSSRGGHDLDLAACRNGCRCGYTVPRDHQVGSVSSPTEVTLPLV